MNSVFTRTSWRTGFFKAANIVYMFECIAYIRVSMLKNFIMNMERCSEFVNGCSTVDRDYTNTFQLQFYCTLHLCYVSGQWVTKSRTTGLPSLRLSFVQIGKTHLAHPVRTRGFTSNAAYISSRKLSKFWILRDEKINRSIVSSYS